MRKEASNLAQFTLNFQESEQSNVDVSSLFLKLMTALVQSLESLQHSTGGGSGGGSSSNKGGGMFSYTNRVTFPQPMVDLTSQDILVESCEEGPLLSHLLLQENEGRDGGTEMDSALKKKIARIGLHTIFKMIFIDNFIHAGEVQYVMCMYVCMYVYISMFVLTAVKSTTVVYVCMYVCMYVWCMYERTSSLNTWQTACMYSMYMYVRTYV